MKPSLRISLPAIAALALASAAPAPAAEPAKKTPAAALADEAPIYDTDAIGEKAIAFYQKAASDSGRRLLLNLGTNDCSACKIFNRALHKDKFFSAFNQQFVPANVDVSNMPNAALIDKYLINPRAELPAILVFMPDGRLIEALAHGEMAAIAKKGEGAVQEWLLSRFAKSE
jgi:thiol:disulfide interchange protein